MDSPPRRKSGLNLPSGMTETSLRLDTLPRSGAIRVPSVSSPRTITSLSSPNSKSSTCSDRFIPCRSSSRLHTFGLIDKGSPVKEGGNEAYCKLLKSELFGSDFASLSSPAGGSPSKNIFRFKTEHSCPNSPYSPSILGHDSGVSTETSTPPKPPRKVPKTPHKVQLLCVKFLKLMLLEKCSIKCLNGVFNFFVAGFRCSITSR